MTYVSTFLWLKALHIIFVICWFAGLFYLPRLFVNHAMTESEDTRKQLSLMERKLYRFMAPLALLAAFFGFWMLAAGWEAYGTATWMHAKLVLVLLLVIYHLVCGYYVRALSEGRTSHSHVFFRVFNELPVLLLFAVVILVVVRPF